MMADSHMGTICVGIRMVKNGVHSLKYSILNLFKSLGTPIENLLPEVWRFMCQNLFPKFKFSKFKFPKFIYFQFHAPKCHLRLECKIANSNSTIEIRCIVIKAKSNVTCIKILLCKQSVFLN